MPSICFLCRILGNRSHGEHGDIAGARRIHLFSAACLWHYSPVCALNYYTEEVEFNIMIEIASLDEMLFAFMVPLLPHIFENRLELDTSLTQRLTSIFLVEGALISIISSPFIGDIADRASSKKVLLLVLLVLTLISVLCLSITTSREF